MLTTCMCLPVHCWYPLWSRLKASMLIVDLRHQDTWPGHVVTCTWATLQGRGELELVLVLGSSWREQELCQLLHEELFAQPGPINFFISLLHKYLNKPFNQFILIINCSTLYWATQESTFLIMSDARSIITLSLSFNRASKDFPRGLQCFPRCIRRQTIGG